MASNLVLFQHNIVEVLTKPENRWWLTKPRKKIEVLAYLSPIIGTGFNVKTFDISENGVFIPLDESQIPSPKFSKNPFKLGINDKLSLCLNFGKLTQVRLEARIVRKTDG